MQSMESVNPNNKLIPYSLKILVKMLIKEFTDQTYNYRRILDIYHQKTYNTSYPQQHIKELQNIWNHIQIYISRLASSPSIWIQMLHQQLIFAQQSNYIHLNHFNTKIYKQIIKNGIQYTPYFIYFSQTTKKYIYQLISEISTIVTFQYNRGCQKVISNMNNISLEIQKCTFINIYVLYKMLRDVSKVCRKKISQRCYKSILMYSSHQVSDQFAHYILQKYQILTMKMTESTNINEIKQIDEYINLQSQIKLCSKLSWRQAEREDGQSGICIQLTHQDQSQNQKLSNYIIKVDEQGEMQIVNANSLTKQWKFGQQNKQQNQLITDILNNKKSLLQQLIKNKNKRSKQLVMTTHLNSIGNNIGGCLANMQKYENIGDFMTDLSSKVVIGGSFNYMLLSIPIISYIFVAGGFSYSFYFLFKDQIKNSQRKLQTIGNITIDVSSSIGSGLIGLLIGQAIIPIPIIGAFIGGIIGGVMGHLGGQKVNKLINNARFKHLIQQLKENLKPEGYWQSTTSNIKRIGIDVDHFKKSTPQQYLKLLQGYRIWLTTLCFIFITYDLAIKRQAFLNNKLTQMNKNKVQGQESQIIVKKQFQNQQYIIKIMEYLQDNNVIILKYARVLQQLMEQLLIRIQ